MKKSPLIELLRDILGAAAVRQVVIAGSQAFHGLEKTAPAVVVQSIEVDILLIREDFSLRQAIENRFGMGSAYLSRKGVFAHPVGLGTITLHPGWEARLVPFGRDEGLNNVGLWKSTIWQSAS